MEATPTAAAAAAGEGAEAAGAFAGKDGATRPSTTPEEEALKRNTDCVYFLASPLTCKKGAECEYRHSEGARVNPRDCYYWLNSNCLNPKCSFRHPPLEGLFGTATTASGPLPPPQAVTPAQAASYSSRQSVPCYYFQRGQCLKGDRCAFMHGATPMANPAQQQAPKIAATQVSEPQQVLKKPSWAVEKCNQNILKDNVAVPAKVANVTKRIPALGTGSAVSNGLVVKNNVQIKTELPSRSEIKNVPISFGNVPNRLQTHRSDLADEQLLTERDGDEFIQESSPGFDVLVDDENEDPGYYHNEDEYRDPSGNDGRSFKPITEFDYSHKFEYENAARFSRERQREEGEYDDHVQLRDYYDRERRVSSSDLTLERASASKRSRMDTVSDVDGSDLRHRLLKQRRFNERRPGVGPDQPSELHRPTDRHAEEHRYRSRRHHDDQHHTSGRISVSKRLQGRISLPGRMPAQPDADILDKVTDTGRDWVGRSSVGRTSSNQGRNRVRQRSSEEIPSGVRRPASHVVKSEEVEKPGFVRPKRLSELKGTNDSESSDQRSSRVTKDVPSTEQKDMRLRRALGNHQETEPATFEGPKSLSDILKRKREAAALSHHKADSETDGHGHSADSMSATAMPVKEAGSISPLQDAAGEREKEEGIIPTDEERQDPVADANDSEYIEAENGEYDQGEGEYAYEQNEDGEEYYYEDEEGVYQEEGAYQEDGAYQEEGMMEQEEGAYQEDGTYQEEDGMIEQEGAYQDEEGMMEQEDGSADFVGKLDEPMPN